MNRRNFLALLSTPVLVALLEACSSDSASTSTTTAASGKPREVRSELARTATSPSDALEAADTVDSFGMDLYRLLAKSQPDGNLVFSPASIAMALTMVAVGAKGTTLDELVAALHVDSPDTVHHAMNSMSAELASRSVGDVTLSIANSLWAQDGFTIETRFLDVLATEYDAGVHLVDYRTDPDGARTAINGWVSDRTESRIPELLTPGTVTPDARLTIVNAVYLKAPWLQTFNPELTRDGTFTTTDGTAKQVPMMYQSTTLPYASGDGWQAVELAYDSDDLTMLVFLPEAGFLKDFEQIFLVSDATSYLSTVEVNLRLPKFAIETALSLSDTLQALGITTAFSPDADLSGISTDDELRISDVIHQANINVDEGGTEAAAATAVIVEVGSAAPDDGPQPIEFNVDRPFVFALRDRGTEAILFIGRVGDPG